MFKALMYEFYFKNREKKTQPVDQKGKGQLRVGSRARDKAASAG